MIIVFLFCFVSVEMNRWNFKIFDLQKNLISSSSHTKSVNGISLVMVFKKKKKKMVVVKSPQTHILINQQVAMVFVFVFAVVVVK